MPGVRGLWLRAVVVVGFLEVVLACGVKGSPVRPDEIVVPASALTEPTPSPTISPSPGPSPSPSVRSGKKGKR